MPAALARDTAPTVNLGVMALNTQSTPGGPAFIMSSTSWISLQAYLDFVRNLPSTIDTLKAAMGTGAPDSMSDFDKLVKLYVSMQTEGATFTNTTYRSIVQLASDIFDYGNNVTVCYDGLQQCISQLKANPQDPQAKTNLLAVVNLLSTNAKSYQTRASAVNTALKNFVSAMQQDKSTLMAPGSGYYDYYNHEYGADSDAVQEIVKQLSDDHDALDAAQAKYKQDVIIASTTPAYLWVPIVGWVAGPIVAGVFGSAATNDLKRISGIQDEISNLEDKQAADALLMQGLQGITSNIKTLSDELDTAISIVQSIEGAWNAIASDLDNLTELLTTQFSTTLAFLLQLDFNMAINDWKNLAAAADAFRVNAFITPPSH